jgi:MFS family permease
MNSGNGTENRLAIKSGGISFPWLVVLLGALLLFSSNIYNNTFGVFFKPIAEDFGWSRAAMSGSFTIRSIACAALVAPMGYLADRYGPRRVLLPCFILLGICTMAVASVTTLWQLYLIQGIGIGIASSGPFVCIMSTVAKWHKTRRGLALGITSAGAGLSSVIFPPVATKLIEVRDWQFAIFIIGIIILAIGVPASLNMKDPPNVIERPTPSRTGISRGPFDAWDSLLKFPRSPALLAIIMMFVLIGVVGNLLMNHLVNYATDIGITALVAAGMMSAVGVASATGRFGMGAISDRIGTRKDAALCCILLVASFVLLISKIPALMWVAAVLFGMGFGGTAPLIPAIMGEWVGTEQLSTATGVTTMGYFAGAALGPWLGGLIFDVSGSYLWALLLGAGVSLVALIIALRTPSALREISKPGKTSFEE